MFAVRECNHENGELGGLLTFLSCAAKSVKKVNDYVEKVSAKSSHEWEMVLKEIVLPFFVLERVSVG